MDFLRGGDEEKRFGAEKNRGGEREVDREASPAAEDREGDRGHDDRGRRQRGLIRETDEIVFGIGAEIPGTDESADRIRKVAQRLVEVADDRAADKRRGRDREGAATPGGFRRRN